MNKGLEITGDGLKVSGVWVAIAEAIGGTVENGIWTDAAAHIKYQSGKPWCKAVGDLIIFNDGEPNGKCVLRRIAAIMCRDVASFHALHDFVNGG